MTLVLLVTNTFCFLKETSTKTPFAQEPREDAVLRVKDWEVLVGYHLTVVAPKKLEIISSGRQMSSSIIGGRELGVAAAVTAQHLSSRPTIDKGAGSCELTGGLPLPNASAGSCYELEGQSHLSVGMKQQSTSLPHHHGMFYNQDPKLAS